ncbi:TPA: hypothetical protein ACN973_004535, partial [Vibrio parahaemolyticus]
VLVSSFNPFFNIQYAIPVFLFEFTMSLEFGFSRFGDANKFGKNISSNLKATTVYERRGSKHFIVIPEKNQNMFAASTLIVSIAVASLVSGSHHLTNEKFNLVVEALQRANPSLEGLTESEIGSYLSELSSEQLSGVVSNTKGVYHEMLYVESFNAESLGNDAILHSDLNNPGADVIITDGSGNIVQEVQLKATDSTSYISEHLDKYPEVEVLATEEVAARMSNVESSGFSNEELTNDVVTSFDELESISSTVTEEVSSSLISDEITGFGPLSIVTGLLFGIF